MTLTPKSQLPERKLRRHQGRRHALITNLLSVFIPLSVLLPFTRQVAAATLPNSPSPTAACHDNPGLEGQISRLTNTSMLVSTWLSKPQFGIPNLVQLFAPQVFGYLGNSSLTQRGWQNGITQTWEVAELLLANPGFDFTNPVERQDLKIDNIPLTLVSGGRPITIHANSRYHVKEILASSGTNAAAAVDGTFFSMRLLTSNVMIGPVLSQVTNQFIPGNNSENQKLTGRPLVLISPDAVRYLPFEGVKHNTLAGIQAELPGVTDAFVGAAWLVKNRQPQPKVTFSGLFGADIARHRAFWGINRAGQPVVGVTTQDIDSAGLGVILAKAGLRDAVMLDSGQSADLVYKGESVVSYDARPVPHAVALVPLVTTDSACVLASR